MSFSFGTPSSAPATSALAGGFSFGTNKPATPAFGLSATTQASTGLFGSTTTSAPAFGATSAAPAFGSTTTPAFGTISTPAFGASATPAFGSTTTPAFGSTTTPAFGSTTTPAFGSTTTPAFGATTTSAFGTSATPAFGSTSFGTGGLNFGAGANTSAQSTGLSFGATPITSASAGLGGFGFGTATTQSTGFGLFGSTSTATTSSSLFGAKLGTTSVTGTQPSTLVTPSLGLGGLGAPAAGGIGATNTTTSGDGKTEPPKQTKLPNEISTTVDSFKEFVKKQKSLSSEVMQISIKPLHKVSREAEATLRLALSLGGEVSRARAQSRRLRSAAAAALAAAESAARVTPGTELEGSAPPSYVKDLISELEQQMITFRRQMDVADKQMQASPRLLTEQELTLGIRRMHESLVALAGRLQVAHTQVEAQKEQYLNLRKYILKDPTNVFETPSSTTSLDQILSDAERSRKKSKTKLAESNYASAVLSDPKLALGSIQQLAGPTPFTYVGSTLSAFPAADVSGASWQPQTQPSLNSSFGVSGFAASAPTGVNSSFQLQKPPGKRGKQ